MKHIKFLFLVFVILGVVVTLVQNNAAFLTKVVFKLDLGIASYQTPEINIYVVSLIAFTLGVIITWVYGLLERFQLKRQIRSLKHVSKEKDKELNSLRNLPITSENVTSGVPENDI